ncbi:MAG TPA: hypothetical protein PLR37_11020 [Candidatus Accumulibacter phosphatis]|nr:hypothetical protein [Candidatus Accumulibacter phosphatis]
MHLHAAEVGAESGFHARAHAAFQRLSAAKGTLDGLFHAWSRHRLSIGLCTLGQEPLHKAIAVRALEILQRTGLLQRPCYRVRLQRVLPDLCRRRDFAIALVNSPCPHCRAPRC